MSALLITLERGADIIKNKKPTGQYIFKEKGLIVAVDNSSGTVEVERFKLKRQADNWLLGIPCKNAAGKWLNMR